jgi:hypothetical protein
VEGTDKRRSVPVSTFRVSQDLEARDGSFNSRTCEWRVVTSAISAFRVLTLRGSRGQGVECLG